MALRTWQSRPCVRSKRQHVQILKCQNPRKGESVAVVMKGVTPLKSDEFPQPLRQEPIHIGPTSRAHCGQSEGCPERLSTSTS
jgi:hypothetical protein